MRWLKIKVVMCEFTCEDKKGVQANNNKLMHAPIFHALLHGQGDVVGASIPFVGPVIQNRRPQHGAADLRLDGDADVGELRFASLLDVAQVDVEGEDPDPARALDLVVDVVVVDVVELLLLVAEELKVLLVRFRYACDVLNPGHDATSHRVLVAFLLAPLISRQKKMQQ